jgi:nucleoid-associated protein YgaU
MKAEAEPVSRRWTAAAAALLVAVGVGCQSTPPQTAAADGADRADWVYQLHAWYPDWRNEGLEQPGGHARRAHWAYNLQQWYPDWTPKGPPPLTGKVNPAPVPVLTPPQPPPPVPDQPPPPPAAAAGEPVPAPESAPAVKESFAIEPAPAASAPAPAAVRYHTVKEGESAYDIAQQYYRDRKAWRRLQEANPYVILSPKQLTAGATIRVP